MLAYLVKAQIILDGVRRVEDGPVGSDDQDEAVESLRDHEKKQKIKKKENLMQQQVLHQRELVLSVILF